MSALSEKRSVVAWCELARRGAEDGHGDEWIDQISAGERIKAAMRHAAAQARKELADDIDARLSKRVSG